MSKKTLSTTVDTTTIEKDKNAADFEIPAECVDGFVKAIKISYYKEFYKKGLITAEQLEMLISMQNNKASVPAA